MTTDLYALGMRARNAVWACFFFLGFLGLAWIPRIPEIKDSLALSDGQFGLVLLASTVGSVPGAQIAGRVVHMYSSKLVVRISGLLLPVGVFVIGLADNVQILLLGLFITGFNVAFMDIAINGQAVEIEKHTKGRWMSSFHGFWSIGAFAATLVGGLIANFVSPRDNLFAISALGFLRPYRHGEVERPDLRRTALYLACQQADHLPWRLRRGAFPIHLPHPAIRDRSLPEQHRMVSPHHLYLGHLGSPSLPAHRSLYHVRRHVTRSAFLHDPRALGGQARHDPRAIARGLPCPRPTPRSRMGPLFYLAQIQAHPAGRYRQRGKGFQTRQRQYHQSPLLE